MTTFWLLVSLLFVTTQANDVTLISDVTTNCYLDVCEPEISLLLATSAPVKVCQNPSKELGVNVFISQQGLQISKKPRCGLC